jgi:hypothetical protein
MNGCLFGKRSDMQAAETDKSSVAAVMVRNPIRSVGVRDVNLDHNQLWCIVEGETLNMFIHNDRAVVGRQICGECSQP